MPIIDKTKYLTPGDLTLGQFAFILRKRMSLPPELAIFIFINNQLPTNTTLIRELYAKFADKDGFLYLTYCGEATFG
jgi:GABA(A) receptor-associated protein